MGAKMKQEIIFLKPVFKEMIWGGNRMREEFGYDIPGEHTGECWAVSAHENGDCMIASGQFEGMSLSQLWKEHRELFGNLEGDKFPLLVKIIDAKDDLSIQVHPDDAYAMMQENGSLGKTECWYILDCEAGTDIVIGHNASTHEELCTMIDEGRWDELIRTQPIKKGDFFQINPGTVHAIKGGTRILEIQQNSDVTYRVYDYNRLSDGKPRELHVEKSKAVIQVPYETDISQKGSADQMGVQGEAELVSCPYYTVKQIKINESKNIKQDAPFLIVSVIDGSGMIDGIKIKKGSHFIIPYHYGEFHLQGNMEIICSSVFEK